MNGCEEPNRSANPDVSSLMRAYKEEEPWRTQRFETAMRSDLTEAYEIARELLKSLIILHGGSMALLPPLIQIIKPSAHDATLSSFGRVFFSGSAGLLSAIVALFCAYFTVRSSAIAASYRWQEQQFSAWQAVYMRERMIDQAMTVTTEAKKLELRAEQQNTITKRLEVASLLFAFVSAVLFLVLAIVAADVVNSVVSRG